MIFKQFYASHPSIYQFLEVLIGQQTFTYIKMRNNVRTCSYIKIREGKNRIHQNGIREVHHWRICTGTFCSIRWFSLQGQYGFVNSFSDIQIVLFQTYADIQIVLFQTYADIWIVLFQTYADIQIVLFQTYADIQIMLFQTYADIWIVLFQTYADIQIVLFQTYADIQIVLFQTYADIQIGLFQTYADLVHFTSTFKLLIFIKLNIILLKTLLPLSVGEQGATRLA